MSEAEYYWPSTDEPGEYTLERRVGDYKDWEWDGKRWRRGMWFRDTSQMVEWGYLGVRRANTLTPTPKALTPDPDDGNAIVAQQALDEWRACKQAPKAADWAYRWAVDLCERLGAR